MGLAAALREREAAIRRLLAQQGEIVAEMQSRGPMAAFGYADVTRIQMDLLKISRKDARARTGRALACNAYHEVGPVPVFAPETAQAFGEGAIGLEHVDVLTDILGEIPGEVPPDERAGYEKTLVELAREVDPAAVRKAGRHLLDRLNADGHPPTDDELRTPDRELLWQWRDGKLKFTGFLDLESGELLETLLSPLAKPRPADDGEPDTRTLGHRQGDALAELLDAAARCADLPTEAGETPALIVTVPLADLLRDHGDNADGAGAADHTDTAADDTGSDGAEATDSSAAAPARAARFGVGWVNWTTRIDIRQVRRMVCDSRILRAVLGADGEVLDLGREVRTVTRAQRRALALRDKGCVFDGCTRPVRFTQAHHIKPWIDHGDTDIANLCLVCAYHHRLLHHSDWEIRMAADGHPECIPPAWLDPLRRPRRNRAHDPL